MAINVYLTLFKKFTAQQLKSLEWRYLLICYGGPFLIALAYLFVNTEERGKMYGDAQLWCWISPRWAFMRIALFYGISWLCISVSFVLYLKSGCEILRKRRELLAFSRASAEMENPFTAFKTVEVSVTSELLNSHVQKPLNAFNPARLSRNTSDTAKGYAQYSTKIRSTHSGLPFIGRPRTGSMSTQFHKNTMALDANTAAWGYTKVALLFFVSLLVTWVPSSINRIYDLAYPGHVSYPLNYASAIVLPLMGFWNSVIYIFTTRALCKALFFDALDKLTFRRTSSQIEPGRVSMREFRPPSGGELRRLQQIS
ncbi:MAG: hypothetical protein Q9214_002305 [Letrouitia sp. 1 TL-2023]